MAEDEKRVQFSVSVTPETREGARILKARGVKLGRHVDELVADLLETTQDPGKGEK